ncbi:small heat shock protein [Laetiporus sulphureus 93-53]|uniref:Small heat shock protein n=1 Tax=Laetiporus sulphureus 93-53 TaxID=1314785 RepID=A0A165F7M7_9APHY|nr:small heat shock protein [Laetiporus sulphureus 93-53]KZT08549.1 small heat shock protein [Laetiporus sulphureus 93-53]
MGLRRWRRIRIASYKRRFGSVKSESPHLPHNSLPHSSSPIMSFAEFYYDPFVEFNHMLDQALTERNVPVAQALQAQGPQRHRNRGRGPWPRLDVHENKKINKVVATFELPGLKKDDVSIEVHNNRVVVSGEVKQPEEVEESEYPVHERHVGKFSRSFQLPAGLDTSTIKASMENGLLTISFPMAAPETAPKKITVA